MATQDIESIVAADAPLRTKPSVYPEPFASQMKGRSKRPLGDLFSLTNFGVNLTTIAPGGVSALRHAHSNQDEFVYIISGEATLISAGYLKDKFQAAFFIPPNHQKRYCTPRLPEGCLPSLCAKRVFSSAYAPKRGVICACSPNVMRANDLSVSPSHTERLP